VVLVEVFLQGPEAIEEESAAELDADPVLHAPITIPGEKQLVATINRLLSVLDSHGKQFELDRGEDPGGNGMEVKEEVLEGEVLCEKGGISFEDSFILGEAFDEDVGRSVVGSSKRFQSISSRRLASSSSRGTASSKGGSAWSCDGDWSWSEVGAEVTGESVGGSDEGLELCIEKRSGESSVLSVSRSNLEKKSVKSS